MAPSLICSFVMRRTVILAECSNHLDQEDVARLALNLLETLDRSMRRITYERDGYTFNYLIDCGYSNISFSSGVFIWFCFLFLPSSLFVCLLENFFFNYTSSASSPITISEEVTMLLSGKHDADSGKAHDADLAFKDDGASKDDRAYSVVADEDIGREIPHAFLNQVRKDFLGKYSAQFVKALIANSLSNELGSKLKEHMEYVAAKVSKDEQVAMEYIEKNRGWHMRRKSKAPSLSYSFVAHGTVVLADWLQFDHTVSGLAVDYLSELPCSINKITYDRGGCTINYLLDSNFTYCVVAAKAMGRKIPLAFLDQIKKDFTARFGGGLAVATVENSLNKDFRSKLKERMRHAEVKAAQASKDKGVTMETIEKVRAWCGLY
ncbi:hypothetical protein C1H46_020444 [Malus baccata]|uniref:Longin domain-containing protein n=1 Tax=Malus baccata TaxID=106549 RepID=A0A540M5B1_MALBA|nr:hypothetical protein C1H46_020444 [Malus baccata]